jgi:hypothetical protein
MREVLVYIHGVSPLGTESHDADYQALHRGIRKHRPEFPENFCGVEWGWRRAGDTTATSHQLLSDAERHLGARAIHSANDPSDFTLNLLRIAVEKFRPLMIYNFADMFYYASEDGKNALRFAVAQQIVQWIKSAGGGGGATEPISLTLLGHSAGSIIAFDFLFFLFSTRPVTQFIKQEKVSAGPSTRSTSTDKPPRIQETLDELEHLKSLATSGQLRIRRLFTFGSPITALAFRSDAVVKVLSQSPDARLSAKDYGLLRNDAAFGAPLAGPRWINIWDKDDPIAWPVEPLMLEANSAVKDRYIDVSDSPTEAHSAYWNSTKVHAEFARSW